MKEFKLLWTSENNDQTVTAYFTDIESLQQVAGMLYDNRITYYAYKRINGRWGLIEG